MYTVKREMAGYFINIFSSSYTIRIYLDAGFCVLPTMSATDINASSNCLSWSSRRESRALSPSSILISTADFVFSSFATVSSSVCCGDSWKKVRLRNRSLKTLES